MRLFLWIVVICTVNTVHHLPTTSWRGVGWLPYPIAPWNASNALHEAKLSSMHNFATMLHADLVTGFAHPERGGVPVVAVFSDSHLLVRLASRTAVVVGSDHGDQSEQDKNEG